MEGLKRLFWVKFAQLVVDAALEWIWLFGRNLLIWRTFMKIRAMQDGIYRDMTLRARKMTLEQRFEVGFYSEMGSVACASGIEPNGFS